MEEGRWMRDEERRMREEGRGKREEGRGKRKSYQCSVMNDREAGRNRGTAVTLQRKGSCCFFVVLTLLISQYNAIFDEIKL